MNVPVIVKREPKRNGGELIIFYDDVFIKSSGFFISSFVKDSPITGRYNTEVSYEYYLDCDPVDYTDPEVQALISYFLKQVNIFSPVKVSLKLRKRLSLRARNYVKSA